MRWFAPERLLDPTAPPADVDLRPALQAFAHFLLLHLMVRDGIRALEGSGPVRVAWAVGFGACLLASFWPRALRPALLAALGLVLWKFARIFPHNSNHFFLEFLSLGFLCLVRWSRVDELRVAVAGLRWIPALVLFWSGVNKLIYGTYFNGAFLGSLLTSKGFGFVFSFFLPAEEFARLLETRPPGPYAFDSALGLLVSNGIWVGEIATGLMLLVPRLRTFGIVLTLGLLLGIELGAHEVMFGILLVNLLALHATGPWSVRALAMSAAVYALAVVAKLGWLPVGTLN